MCTYDTYVPYYSIPLLVPYGMWSDAEGVCTPLGTGTDLAPLATQFASAPTWYICTELDTSHLV